MFRLLNKIILKVTKFIMQMKAKKDSEYEFSKFFVLIFLSALALENVLIHPCVSYQNITGVSNIFY
jgi:hypothetical protein